MNIGSSRRESTGKGQVAVVITRDIVRSWSAQLCSFDERSCEQRTTIFRKGVPTVTAHNYAYDHISTYVRATHHRWTLAVIS